MSYRDQLQPWCVVRFLPDARSIVVARFRRRSDAEAHQRILRQILPTATYSIVFDSAINKPDSNPANLSSPSEPMATPQPPSLSQQ